MVLPRLPVLLLVDNAEDLLTGDPGGREVADPDLAGFLAAWVQAAPRARLLVTSRYPFTLPGRRTGGWPGITWGRCRWPRPAS